VRGGGAGDAEIAVMKTKIDKNIAQNRIAACMGGARLIKICVRAAGRVPVSKSVSVSHLSAGVFFSVGTSSGSINTANLTRCGIF
jgi:hypothetical protein